MNNSFTSSRGPQNNRKLSFLESGTLLGTTQCDREAESVVINTILLADVLRVSHKHGLFPQFNGITGVKKTTVRKGAAVKSIFTYLIQISLEGQYRAHVIVEDRGSVIKFVFKRTLSSSFINSTYTCAIKLQMSTPSFLKYIQLLFSLC